MAQMRLDKVLSSQNAGSRKEIAQMAHRGEIAVNGQIVRKADCKIDPEVDKIVVGGKVVCFKQYRYFMMNKPQGVLCATKDLQAQTVLDLLPQEFKRRDLFPAGRLDRDTEGLLIITDDGAFAHRMLSPKKHVVKYYHALVDSPVTVQEIEQFAKGVALEDFTCLPAELRVLKIGEHPLVEVKICEGKFHQIKRMFGACGKKVLWLKRVQIGSLMLDPDLKAGDCKELSIEEINSVFR